MIAPFTILPGGIGMSRMSERAVTVLPQPDSPTSPSVSPAASSKDTPSTARTTPSRVKNCVCRSLTARSSGTPLPFPSKAAESTGQCLGLHPRVERVAKAVADEGEGQHDDRDAERWKQDRPGRGREDHESLVDHHAPGRRWRLDPDTEERQRRLGEHRARDAERDGDDDGREHVRKEVPYHDAPRLGTDRTRGLDELAFLQGEHLAADQPRHADPVHQGDGDEHEHEASAEIAGRGVPQHRHDDEEEEQVGERVDHVGDAHEQVVDPTAVVAGEHPDADADQEDQRDRDEAHPQRDPRRPDEPAEDVASELIAPEWVLRICVLRAAPERIGEGVRRRLLDRVAWAEEGREDRDHHEDGHDAEPDHRGPVAAQAEPGVLPQRALPPREDVELQGTRLAGRSGDRRHQRSNLMRGSTMPYVRSTTRFATAMRTAYSMYVPMMSG